MITTGQKLKKKTRVNCFLRTFHGTLLGQESDTTCNTTCSLVNGPVLCGYLEEAMSVGEVAVEVAALVQLL